MKLHLTATSERGKPITKSGNEFIDILVNNEKRENVCRFNVDYQEGYGTKIELLVYSTGEKHIISLPEPKTASECEHYGCGNFAESGSDYCIAH